MGKKDKIDLFFDDVKYSIDTKKLVYVLSRLKGSKISFDDVEEIKRLIKYYNLDKIEILKCIDKI